MLSQYFHGWRVGNDIREEPHLNSLVVVMVSSSQPKLTIWVRLCDLCSLLRYLLDFSLSYVDLGYGSRN